MIEYLFKKYGYEKKSRIFNFLPETKLLIEQQDLINQIISEKVTSGELKQAEELTRVKETIDDLFLLQGFLNDGDHLEKFIASKTHKELKDFESDDEELPELKARSHFIRNEKQNYEYVVKNKNKN
ncbi:hypothetical protein CWC28_03365 [Pseudoalteromonas sp. S4492]|uniref:hypothetical protein n=1 Tax=Pseudoalteromonas sp. S4492 TaxID=579560 RepID=UPI00110A21C6|nr:hypothetical protein [Pseudoalteromonas sp. S4492]TMO30631.1 hypothetical protein CWC28_03365 [Pseudoalteromonas sp. S4492]